MTAIPDKDQIAKAESEFDLLKETLDSMMDRTGERVSSLVAGESGITELRAEHDVKTFTYPERRALLEGIFIEYPRLQEIKAKIRECHEDGLFVRRFSSAEPACMFISGQSNAGKSALMAEYERSFTRVWTGDHTVVPILPVILPYPAKPKSVAIQLLKKLGDPIAERGNTAVLSSRVAGYIKDCKVELIVLDELHHFIDRSTSKILHDVSEWLKTLILETKVPVIALGKPAAAAVLDYDEQLRRRFYVRRSLGPFDWDFADPASVAEFRRFLKALDFRLPLAASSPLHSMDWAFRIHYATDGVVGYVITLMKGAALQVLNDGREQITLGDLAHSFDERIKSAKPKKENPFRLSAFTPEEAQQWKSREEEPDMTPLQPPRHRKQRASEILRK